MAKKVLGEVKDKRRFPDDWESKVLQGVVVARCTRGRSVSVQWPCITTPLRVSTRILERQDANADTNAALAVTAAEAAANDANNGVSAPRVTRSRRGRPRRTEPVPAVVAGITDDEMEEIPECDGIDSGDEVVDDEEEESEEDDDTNIKAHGTV